MWQPESQSTVADSTCVQSVESTPTGYMIEGLRMQPGHIFRVAIPERDTASVDFSTREPTTSTSGSSWDSDFPPPLQTDSGSGSIVFENHLNTDFFNMFGHIPGSNERHAFRAYDESEDGSV